MYIVWSDIVERPCDQLPTPAEHASVTSHPAQVDHHSADGIDHHDPSSSSSSSDHIVNEKYISDRDLPESRRTDSNRGAPAVGTVTRAAAVCFVLCAVFHSVTRSAF